ncbi:MAG: hypothetical protein CME25_08765 [Gemmatimonadetes bacterium]|nr:hypothetical protein [Gemmatimonadota bacterium]|tara:strand:- start:149 stop:1624 length:1476 start_codon:yes stop_codon:yes gene_type:complete
MKSRGAIFANIVIGGSLFILLSWMIYLGSVSSFSKTLVFVLVAFACGVGLLIFILRCKENIKVNISLSILSVGFSLFLTEILLVNFQQSVTRNLRYELTIWYQEFRDGFQFDNRTRLQVINDLRAKNIEAYPRIGTHYHNPHVPMNRQTDPSYIIPLSGIENSTTVFGNESGEWLIYQSDEHGFRNPEGLYDKDIDIVLIGDSFVQGCCVQEGEDIRGHLSDAGYTTLNLGYSGNGPLTCYATFREYVEPLKPMHVVWLFFEGNDIKNMSREMKSSILMSYLNEDFTQRLLYRQEEIQKFLIEFFERRKAEQESKNSQTSSNKSWFEGSFPEMFARISRPLLLRRTRALLNLTDIRQKMGLETHKRFQERQKQDRQKHADKLISDEKILLLKEILNKANNKVSSWGGRFYFVSLPSWERLYRKESETEIANEVLNVVKDLKIPTIDVYEVFIDDSDPLSFFPFRMNGHYNSKGYKKVAERIIAQIKKQGLN